MPKRSRAVTTKELLLPAATEAGLVCTGLTEAAPKAPKDAATAAPKKEKKADKAEKADKRQG